MNHVRIILILLLSALPLMVAKPVNAQQTDRQMEQIHRDINIMESILQEMFKVKPASASAGFHALSPPFSAWNSGRSVEGVYVDGYGIILFVPHPASDNMLLFNRSEKDFTYSFYYGRDDAPDSVLSRESVISQITEFFINYAPASVRHLEPDEKLTVLFGGRPSERVRRRAQFFAPDSVGAKPFLQTVSVTARKADIAAYQTNQLTEEAFKKRFRVSAKDRSESENLDLKIMANILKTALTEDGGQYIRTGGDINFIELDDFGAVFFLDLHLVPFPGSAASFRSAALSRALQYHTSRTSDTFNPDSIASIDVKKDSAGATVITFRNKDGSNVTRSSGRGNVTGPKKNELAKAYKQLIEDMKTYLVDYGRTLNSIEPEQTIVLSVSLASPGFADSIPDHVNLQVKKSVLDAMSKGNLGREEAMEEVTIREY